MKKTKDAIKRQLKEQYEKACNGYLVELLRMWELDMFKDYYNVHGDLGEMPDLEKKDITPEEREHIVFMTATYGCATYIVVLLLGVLICFMFGACTTTKYITVPEYHTDTTYITKHQRDSIRLHDSIFVSEKQRGDTIYLLQERWHTKYIEKQVHDTTYIATHDTIPDPYPVEVEIEKNLNWWQKLLQRTGGIALGLLFVWLGWQAWKIYKRRF